MSGPCSWPEKATGASEGPWVQSGGAGMGLQRVEGWELGGGRRRTRSSAAGGRARGGPFRPGMGGRSGWLAAGENGRASWGMGSGVP